MRLKDLGDLGNIVAATGVIVSLLIVAWEIRNNTAVTRAQASLSMATLANDSFTWIQDPEFADLIARLHADSSAPLSESDRVQYEFYVLGVFNAWEQGYLFHEDGLMSDSVWRGWNNGMLSGTNDEAGRAAWERVSRFYSSEFQAHVDAAFADHPIPSE